MHDHCCGVSVESARTSFRVPATRLTKYLLFRFSPALSGLPGGVSANPASPFSVAVRSTTAVLFGAVLTARPATSRLGRFPRPAFPFGDLMLTVNPAMGTSLPLPTMRAQTLAPFWTTPPAGRLGSRQQTRLRREQNHEPGPSLFQHCDYPRQRFPERQHRDHRRQKPLQQHLRTRNALSVVTPVRTSGPQTNPLTNPDGEIVTLDAASTAN